MTTESLWCRFVPTVVIGDLTGNVSWLKDNVSQFSFLNLSFTKDVETSFELTSGNTTEADLWNCEVALDDDVNVFVKNSSQLTIQSNPTNPAPLLNSTFSEQTNYTNETLACNFLCDDPDDDVLTYDISWYIGGIANISFTSQSCASEPLYVSSKSFVSIISLL